jgi:peptidoglycan/LPS O-acetylase OafA/YrhL
MALSIMLYHFSGQHDAATPLGRLGVYGVSIFFILSGLSMAIAYDRYVMDFRSSVTFFIRRMFRIWPLLWLAVALVAVPTYLLGKGTHGQDPYSITTIVLNLTTLFGFVAPTEYINMGAWSIGNEMVYYAFTPILIGAYHWRKSIGNALTLVTIGIGLLFAFSLLNSANKLEVQWAMYINPFNNFFLYCAGIAIFYSSDKVASPPVSVFRTNVFCIPSLRGPDKFGDWNQSSCNVDNFYRSHPCVLQVCSGIAEVYWRQIRAARNRHLRRLFTAPHRYGLHP